MDGDQIDAGNRIWGESVSAIYDAMVRAAMLAPGDGEGP